MTLVLAGSSNSMDTAGGLSHFYKSNPLRQPGQTQYCNFRLHIGNAFINNPVQHVYVILDGYIWPEEFITPGVDVRPLQGRGIVIGDTTGATGCALSAFEGFGTGNNGLDNEHPSPSKCGSGFTLNPGDSYIVETSVNDTNINYAIKNINTSATLFTDSWSLARPAHQDFDCSNIFIGFTGKAESDISFCNIQTGVI